MVFVLPDWILHIEAAGDIAAMTQVVPPFALHGWDVRDRIRIYRAPITKVSAANDDLGLGDRPLGDGKRATRGANEARQGAACTLVLLGYSYIAALSS